MIAFGLVLSLALAVEAELDISPEVAPIPSDLPRAEISIQPYIDKIKKELDERDSGREPPEGYTDRLKHEIQARDVQERPAPTDAQSISPYIDQLKSENPSLIKPSTSESYSDNLRPSLEPKEQGGAIQAVKDGRSELEFKRPGDIHRAVAISVGAIYSRNFTASGSMAGASYSTIYGSTYDPNFNVQMEWQPFHSEIFGNFGLWASLGVYFNTGHGSFSSPLRNVFNDVDFSLVSLTRFNFVAVPVMVGANYRFNLTYIVRPFVQAGVGVIPFSEARNDGFAAHYGWSYCLVLSGGASIILDRLWRSATWDLYQDFSVKHYYLTADYRMWIPVASEVSFSLSGIFAGLTLEM